MADPPLIDEPGGNEPGEKNRDQRLDEAFAAYLRSCDSGECESRDDFLSQYPDLAEQLKELIEAADAIGQVTLGGQHVEEDIEISGLSLLESERAVPGADTIVGQGPAHHDSLDPAATLPMANRPKGDPGPTLPFDLGDYTLLEVIGRGGMGVVYLAKQHELDRHVAVKMIRGGMLADEDDVRRFYTEAQAAARLHHAGIVSVHQFGRRAGHHFFSMEYIRGTDLQKRINGAILDPEIAARYVRDVALAIHHAHQKEVLHRDLKPANVLIDEHDKIHVTDFGLAKHMDADSSVTGSGAAVGTPHYMAPEQAGGLSDRASQVSDVYSMGAILFACLTGRPPIVADSVMQTLLDVVHNPAPPVRSIRSEVPVDLETIVAKCLEKNPTKRYRSAEKLANDLDAFLMGRPIEARPRSKAMKAWHWMEGVPLVGALTGRRMLDTSVTHRRVQAAMLLMFLMTPLLVTGTMLMWQRHRQTIPSVVRVAGGVEDGIYNDFSQKLADRVHATHDVQTHVIASGGSVENCDHLLAGLVDLAPMQATAIAGDQLCVVAPLFYELLYVLARTDSGITSMKDLEGRSVAVGPIGSGSRAIAELVLSSMQMSERDVPRIVIEWSELFAKDTPEAAMLCIGRDSPLVKRLLSDDRWRLIPIENGIQISLDHPALHPMTIASSEYQPKDAGTKFDGGLPTVGTTAYLAARDNSPSQLVIAALDALYVAPAPFTDLIPRSQVAEWQGLAFHPAARRYFLELSR